MPNWCAGDLKVRGTTKNLKRFLTEGVEFVTAYGDKKGNPVIDSEYEYKISIEDYSHLVGTYRGFISKTTVYFENEDDREIEIIVVPAEFAWDIDVEGLVKLSKEYDVDFRIYAFEQGGQFNRDVEILEGEVNRDETIEFKDYFWECICPHRGG